MKLRKKQLRPLRLDTTGAFHPEHGIDANDVAELLPKLAAIRDAMNER